MVWLRFAGGRGNTAGAAAVTLLSWPTALIGAAIWALARLATRTSFWATRTLFAFWPLALGLLTRSWIYALTAVALSLIYLTTHKTGTDDHLLLKERWPSLWAFLTGPRRR
jgi:glycerol-3-phosphate acyltransferase PlsY